MRPDRDLLVIDCGRCLNRDRACNHCAVANMIREPGAPVEVSAELWRTLAELTKGGLASPIRYRPAPEGPSRGPGDDPARPLPDRPLSDRPLPDRPASDRPTSDRPQERADARRGRTAGRRTPRPRTGGVAR